MPERPLEEGKDYYVENGLYVFTERYLRQRGYCCQSGCRHCPYGFAKTSPPSPSPRAPAAGQEP
jgi:hypothetical protein